MSSIVNTPREITGLLETSSENIIQKVVGEILETVEIMERLLVDVENSFDAPDVVEVVVDAPEAPPEVVNVINASETVAEPPIENPAEDIEVKLYAPRDSEFQNIYFQILDVQSPESSTVVTIQVNPSPVVIHVSVEVVVEAPEASPNVVNVINATETVAEPPIENPAEDVEVKLEILRES